ncbi:MAG: family 20 glycosylhydrolase [Flavobacteriales bacterium]|nr:family 20 glycosylhydrolase [Flavobacteriales bacterium]
MRHLIALLFPLALHAQHGLVPAPVEAVTGTDRCSLHCPWVLDAPGADTATVRIVEQELRTLLPRGGMACLLPLRITLERTSPDTLLPAEWYGLTVGANHIRVHAPTDAGLFRGTRTLVQLLEQHAPTGSIPFMRITDHPRFPWRGMHLDVVRHFWPVDFVKKYIDLLARYKMNSFHWHLTDDQGWRIEIKARPKLTEVGAWRKGSQVGPYSRLEYDSIPYGGFYTQDEIREVVAYAKARHINVVPEIEMPGHAMAALASYPHLGCTGGPYEVQRGWGVFDDVFCAGNDSVVQFLADVIAEVVELFPGPYIHIGGDECPKERWKTCAKCQQRMQDEGLSDEHELQSWLIQHIEKIIVLGYGRQIIGWDEIMEGGLAPTAAVMSWRGTEGGIAAARSGHDAVMSPGSHCYFDHYQGDPAQEPLAFGGHTPLQKVYAYEPIPAELEPDRHHHILGAQGNVWTEYILTTDHVEYMAVPRMLALAEVLWTPKEKRDEADFIRRLEDEFAQLDRLEVNASRSLYQVSVTPQQGDVPGRIDVHFRTGRTGMPMRYDHITEVLYPDAPDPRNDLEVRHGDVVDGALAIDRSCRIEAWAEGGPDGPMSRSRQAFRFNKATARPITLSVQPNERYNAGGAFTLVDGITAQVRRVNTEWLGWKEDVAITIDLGRVQDIAHIGIGALSEPHAWIHPPEHVTIMHSLDGANFLPFAAIERPKNAKGRTSYAGDRRVTARYVRLKVKGAGTIPEGFPGAGNPAWLFLDEVEVR